jgi:hypothetical protein
MKSYWIELGPSESREQRLSTRVTARPISEIIRYKYFMSRDSSVDIATGYGLDGRGSIPGRGNSLSSTASRQILVPTQLPTQWVSGAVSPGCKATRA